MAKNERYRVACEGEDIPVTTNKDDNMRSSLTRGSGKKSKYSPER